MTCCRCSAHLETSLMLPLPHSKEARCVTASKEDTSSKMGLESALSTDQQVIQPVTEIIESKLLCSKCTTIIHFQFLPKLVFLASPILAEINIVGASISDILPSTFLVECSQCSTAQLCRNVYSGMSLLSRYLDDLSLTVGFYG